MRRASALNRRARRLYFSTFRCPAARGLICWLSSIGCLASSSPPLTISYAVQAFDVNALDYLLKPIEPERLAAALGKLQAAAPARREAHEDPRLEQLFVRDGPRCWFIPLREVSVFSAEGNYVRMQWGKERPLLARSLAALESKLDPQRFFRANRQQIINLEFVRSVDLGVGGRLHVQLNDGREIQISRRQARQFRERTTV